MVRYSDKAVSSLTLLLLATSNKCAAIAAAASSSSSSSSSPQDQHTKLVTSDSDKDGAFITSETAASTEDEYRQNTNVLPPRRTKEVLLEETDVGILSSHRSSAVDEIKRITIPGTFASSGSREGGMNDENPSRTVITRALATAEEAGCTSGYVECVFGYLADEITPCAEECALTCCTGLDACKYFTGKVCQDGSCNGDSSCYAADIEFVVNSCKEPDSCFKVSSYSGTAGIIANSCDGDAACIFLGYYGRVGYVQDSCNGVEACKNAAYYATEMVNFKNSCNAQYACYYLGYKGNVGNVKDSCNYYQACKNVARTAEGSIGDILSSCNKDSACKGAGYDSDLAITSSLNNCCNTNESECEDASEATLPAQCTVSDYACQLVIPTLSEWWTRCCWCCCFW